MNAPKKTNRVEDAYTQVKAQILSNRLPPGMQVPEPELSISLGMSRTPVREALIRLQAEGLVELVPRRGLRVLPIRASDMQEIYEILITLESHAAGALARRKPDAQILKPLTEATQSMIKALRTNDLQRWAQMDDQFHRGLLELHGNRRLQTVAASLCDQAHRARMATLQLRDKPKKSTAEHRHIVDAIRTGDAANASRFMREHRERAATEILDILGKLPQL